jgi:hypothetical protein
VPDTRRVRRGVALLAAAVLGIGLLHPAAGRAAEPPKPEEDQRPLGLYIADATFDVLLLRTSGLITLAYNVVGFVPSVILCSPGGLPTMKEAVEHYLTGPSQYVFRRPLAEF